MADPRRAELQGCGTHERPSELLRTYVSDPQSPRPDEVLRLVSELEVHQLELEVHNRALQEAQRQLEAYRDRYVDLYDFAPLGYVTLDEEGYIQELNLAGARLLGGELAELVGYPFTDYVVAPDQTAFLEHIRKCCGQHQDVTSELGLITKDGRFVAVQFHSVPVEAIEDEGTFCKTAITDITDRKRAEEVLQEERNLLRTLIDNLPDSAYVKDIQGRFVAANLATSQVMGATAPNDLLGKTDFDFYPADVAAEYRGDEQELMRSGEPLVNKDEPHLDPKGNLRTVLTTKVPIKDSRGTVIGLVGISRDITERKQVEEALRESEEHLRLALEGTRLNEARLEAVLQVSHMAEASLQEITDFALERAVALTKSKIGYLAFMNEDQTVLAIHSWSKEVIAECTVSNKQLVYPLETTGLWGEAVRQRKPIVTNDYAAPNPLKRGLPEGHVELGRHMNVPILDGEHVVVVAGVGNKDEHYDESDVRQLTLLMEGMWTLIQRQRVQAELQRHRDHLKQLVQEQTQSLQQAHDELRAVYDGMADGLLIADVETRRLVRANATICRMLGYSEDELLSRSVMDLHPANDWPAILKVFQAQAAGQTVVNENTPVLRKDGSVFYADIATNRIFYGLRPCLIGFFRDITDRRQAQEALRKSEDQYRGLIEACPDAVVMSDLNGTVLFASPQTWALLGLAASEKLVGRSVFDYVSEGDRQRLAANMSQITEVGLRRNTEYTALRRDGTTVLAEASSVVIRDSAGKPKALMAVIRDITARKRAEEALKTAEELARSNKDLEQFASVVSHDLQEPLRTVGGFVQLLRKKYANQRDAETDTFIEYALDGTKRMETLIQDLLAYARVTSRSGERVPTDSGGAFRQALDNLHQSIQESGAEITHGELPTVRADPPQLAQLFQNLLGNALKFRSEAPPKIHVGANCEGDYWRFSVRDNGIGIDSQFHDQIFEIFQRLYTHKQYAGTGIGLAICKRIVDRHGGQIWVKSEPGQGATFHFTLPT